MFRSLILALLAPLGAQAQEAAAVAQVTACGGVTARVEVADATPERLEQVADVLDARLGNALPIRVYSAIEPQGDVTLWVPGAESLPDGLMDRAEFAIHGPARVLFDDEERGAGEVAFTDPVNDIRYATKELPIVSNTDIARASAITDQNGRPAVSFEMTRDAGRTFGLYTGLNIGEMFVIVLDGDVISAPVVMSPIEGGQGIVTGDFTPDEAMALASNLTAGALPAGVTLTDITPIPPPAGTLSATCPTR